MARLKQTVVQRDFGFGAIREDFLDSDDLDIRRASLKVARNCRILASRVVEQRPGTFFERVVSKVKSMVEIRPGPGLSYLLVLSDDAMRIVSESGDLKWENTAVPWIDADDVWAEAFREQIVIGGRFGLYMLTFSNDTWSFDAFQFDDAPGGEVLQPYWVFEKGVSITPSATTGTITVTASKDIFTSSHVGLRIRYGFREIRITGFLSPSQVTGVVVNNLPPSISINLKDASEFRAGEVVIGQESGFEGVVSEVSGNTISVVTLRRFEGPYVGSNGEEISSPTGSSKAQARAFIPPLASSVWDEPLMSDLRGWPRSGSVASGRLVMTDLPQAESVIAISSARSIRDFSVGAEDDDAIVREVGDNSPRWLHVINMGDMILLADNGCYIVDIEGNNLLTPSTFNVQPIDRTGSSPVRPARLKDAVIFVEAGGETVSAMVLEGNIYKKWSVRPMSRFYSHIINAPRRLCGPVLNGTDPDGTMFVVNSDGTLASLSWQDNISDERIGFVLWETPGKFICVAPAMGSHWAVVERVVDGASVQMLERFSLGAALDSTIESSASFAPSPLTVNGDDLTVNGSPLQIGGASLSHLVGASVSLYSDRWDAGDHTVDSGGLLTTAPDFDGVKQVGFPFTIEIAPWPTEIIDSPRVGTLKARVLQVVVSVQNSLGFDIQCNGYSTHVGPYQEDDDLSDRPPLRTRLYRFSIFGNRDHPEITITKDRPGPLRVLSIGQRVQA